MPPSAAGEDTGAKAFTCFCEDVSAKDISRSVKEGYDSIELCKRYTTVTMGPCQGKMCHLNSIRLMSRETGQSLGTVGHDDRSAAVDDGSDGRARGPPDRAGEALVDPPPPPRARRQDPVGRRLAPGL